MSTGPGRLSGVAMRAQGTTGLPTAPLSDSLLSWSQPLLTTWVLVFSALTVPHLGRTGVGLYAALLLVVCALHGYSRSLPDRWLDLRVRLLLAGPGAVAAGLLFGVASPSTAVGFGYLYAGHVGFRLPPRRAVALSCFAALVAVVALAAGPHVTDDPWPWWTGLTIVVPVATGLARQNRIRTLAYASELVETSRRAAASEAEAGALAERNRIARDLHDVLAHALSGLSVQLDTADALIEAGRVEEGRAGLQRARDLVVDGLRQARAAVTTLREDAVDLESGLRGSLTGEETLRVELGPQAVPPPVARATLRIAQEALTNARRHAPGAPATVDIASDADTVTLRVTNADPPVAPPAFGLGSGLGVVGMRERVAALGGSLEAGPVGPGDPAGGWRVEARLPLSTIEPAAPDPCEEGLDGV